MEPHRRCLFASSWLHRIYWNSSLSNQSAAGSQTPSSIISREATSLRLASCHGLLILACRMERWWQQPMSCATVRGLAIAVSVLAHSCSYWQGDGGGGLRLLEQGEVWAGAGSGQRTWSICSETLQGLRTRCFSCTCSCICPLRACHSQRGSLRQGAIFKILFNIFHLKV